MNSNTVYGKPVACPSGSVIRNIPMMKSASKSASMQKFATQNNCNPDKINLILSRLDNLYQMERRAAYQELLILKDKYFREETNERKILHTLVSKGATYAALRLQLDLMEAKDNAVKSSVTQTQDEDQYQLDKKQNNMNFKEADDHQQPECTHCLQHHPFHFMKGDSKQNSPQFTKNNSQHKSSCQAKKCDNHKKSKVLPTKDDYNQKAVVTYQNGENKLRTPAVSLKCKRALEKPLCKVNTRNRHKCPNDKDKEMLEFRQYLCDIRVSVPVLPVRICPEDCCKEKSN